jgi:hypothetical protein
MPKTLSKYFILIDTALEAHEVVVVMAASTAIYNGGDGLILCELY